MSLRIVSNSEESERSVALRGYGLMLRELAARVMDLSAQGGDALDFHLVFSRMAEKIDNWPEGQRFPDTEELRRELCFYDQQPRGEIDSPDTPNESVDRVADAALRYIAARHQGLTQQIWAEKLTMLEACAELAAIQTRRATPTIAFDDCQRHPKLSQPMRLALDYFLSNNPIRRSTKVTPRKSTVRALVRRELLEQTGSGLFDYLTNAEGRAEFVGAPA